MFPFLEVFGTKIYMTGLGIVIAGIIFIYTVYRLCKSYNQDFIKFFNWLPVLLVSIYILGLYSTYVLTNWNLIPNTLAIFSPYGYHFGLIGILIAIFFSILLFLSGFRRNENKKIWIDIFFFGLTNAIIALWIFLTLGDNFIGNECESWLCVHALTTESDLVKFSGVYPIGMFLSIGALGVNILIMLWKMTSKKLWLGLWGLILMLGVLLAIMPYWNYPAHGVINLWIVRLDLNHITVIMLIIWLFVLQRRRRKPF